MYERILLPLDLSSPESQTKAAETAVTLAKGFSARVYPMTVIPDYGLSRVIGAYFPIGFEEMAETDARNALSDFVAQEIPADLLGTRFVAHGTIYQEILAVADQVGADLIVMASHRPELQHYLLGPNAARVVRHAKCSVFIARRDEEPVGRGDTTAATH
ncbi:MAG: universal stress protein [Paracoccaceae bacterium]|nr:universal stress protein [Paracoccaceae bacterium]